MSDLRTIIIGAGLGGLCLAQSLARSGLDVQLFERDDGPFERPQGCRLHLDTDAIEALCEVLPTNLHALFEATSFCTEPFTTILRTDLSVVKRLPTDDDHGSGVWPPREGPPEHVNVDRATLRHILLARLGDRIHYGPTFDCYESIGESIIARFTDGSSVEGDLVVGADGIRSAVRRQRAPHARTVDAGITAIYGRAPLGAASGIVPPETLADIFTIASDERKVFLGAGAVRFGDKGVHVQAVLPGATKTEIWDRAEKDVSGMPAEWVMDVNDLVDAALLGFERGEAVTIPPLADDRDWQTMQAARLALLPQLSRREVAPRWLC